MSRAKGFAAELQARAFLERHGCVILAQNYYSPFGEIDLVARFEGAIRFVEVKSGTRFEPIYNITPAKLQRIIRSAHHYLKQNRLDLPFAIDAVILSGERIEWIQNLTL